MAGKAADGTEHTFALTDHAAMDAGKDLDEAAGKKVAHFFEGK